MNILKLRSQAVLSVLLALASMAAIAATSPFLGSQGDPHGTLYLNVDQSAKQIFPVLIWSVDGKLTNRNDQGVLWVKPGDYTFSVKLDHPVNMADVPGLEHGINYGQQEHDLKVTVEHGKAYYIGAKFSASGKWEPVIWKTEDQKN
ncbi:MAG: hypothetical protein ACREP9_05205 [Candidatus Dormibacteraceae bacterium]